jgi:hypothetical protein
MPTHHPRRDHMKKTLVAVAATGLLGTAQAAQPLSKEEVVGLVNCNT